MTTIDLSGLDKRLQQIRSLNNLNARPLMLSWADIIEEDNRRGVLAGLDKDGVPMTPVKYRPKVGKGLRVTEVIRKKRFKPLNEALKQFRLGQRANAKQGRFIRLGPAVSGINNNLSTSEYQLLGGPPLAPRDQFSRSITNLQTRIGGPPNEPEWVAEGAWDHILDEKGRPFLLNHFEGRGRLPRRDLRGVRPQGIAAAMQALRNWAADIFRKHFD